MPPKTEVQLFEQGHAYVCLDLPDSSLPGAHDAVNKWDRALHQWKNISYIDHATPWVDRCSIYVHETTEVRDDDATNHHPMGWASVIGGSEISLRKGDYEKDVSGILLHEMGHIFGAQHVAGTLMNPSWYPGAFVCPDKTTVAQIAAWNQVDVTTLSYCY